jgi:tRNA modification GTPase
MLATRSSILDTVVAQATPSGNGAVAVVRLSGSEAGSILRRLAPAWPVKSESRKLYRVLLQDSQGVHIDDALAVEMPGPRSYTGEDVVELHVHGSQAVVTRLLHVCIAYGARHAEAGEFTLRAFLHGRIDLSQAEAVSDMIQSETAQEQHVATQHLQGVLSQHLTRLCNQLESVLAGQRAVLDFPEYVLNEDDVSGPGGEILLQVAQAVRNILDHQRTDLSKGMRVVLSGPPNAGKSTLLNAWAGYERALVDDQPGTTRDVIDIDLQWKGQRCRLLDTAGLRMEASGVEARGIGMAYAYAAEADRVLWLTPATEPFAVPPKELFGAHVVITKADLATPEQRSALKESIVLAGYVYAGEISSRTGEGVEALKAYVFHSMGHSTGDTTPVSGIPVVVRKRHVLLLEEACDHIQQAAQAYTLKMPLDVVAEDVEKGLMALGRILGRNVDLEVLDRIFAEFCIGK